MKEKKEKGRKEGKERWKEERREEGGREEQDTFARKRIYLC